MNTLPLSSGNLAISLAGFFFAVAGTWCEAQQSVHYYDGDLEESTSGMVRGSVVVGIAIGELSELFSAKGLAVSVPDRLNTQSICVEMNLRNGQYLGSAVARPSGPVQGLAPVVPFQRSTFLSELEMLPVSELSLSARIASQCPAPKNAPYLPVFHRSAGQDMNVYLNSQRALLAEIQIYHAPSPYFPLSDPVLCQEVDPQFRRVAYDYICSLPLAELVTGDEIIIRIRRTMRGGTISVSDVVISPPPVLVGQ
ncbi:MAG: hypothetical protein AAGK03_03805 [Pseudomonadota bacterium]